MDLIQVCAKNIYEHLFISRCGGGVLGNGSSIALSLGCALALPSSYQANYLLFLSGERPLMFHEITIGRLTGQCQYKVKNSFCS